MRKGENWRTVAPEMFKGGSFGNGGAMRVAPLGAYFAGDDPAIVAEQARLSSEITHAHPEGVSGAIAVAVAAAKAWEYRRSGERPSRATYIEAIIPSVPESEVRTRLIKARDLPSTASVEDAVEAVGNGTRVTAQDSVPFVLWSAGEQLDDYEAAIWQTASGGGDVDTTCAMVGGIVAIYTGIESIPAHWLQAREPLPDWAFE
jgi:ADP-ribosylglycohydrolase